jgi:hypothetical protein
MHAEFYGKAWITRQNSMVKILVRIENFLIFLAGLALFHNFSDNWILFILVFFVPDVSMAGYLVNKRVGSVTYNLIHNYALCLLLILFGLVFQELSLMIAASILMSHVGIDRLFGFGLKYSEGFKKTHIQKL